jgi:hypothetical protein
MSRVIGLAPTRSEAIEKSVTLYWVGKRDREESALKSKFRPNAPAHKVGPDRESDPPIETRRRGVGRPQRPCSAPAHFIDMFGAAPIECLRGAVRS